MGANAGARVRHCIKAANANIASTYQASSGTPLAKNCGSGSDCQRSIDTHRMSHAAPMTSIARVGLPDGAERTGLNSHSRANAENQACGRSVEYVGISFISDVDDSPVHP